MKYILIIRTQKASRFDITRDDIERQMVELGWDKPIFVHLEPIEGTEEVEVVWLDEQMEMDKFIASIKNITSTND